MFHFAMTDKGAAVIRRLLMIVSVCLFVVQPVFAKKPNFVFFLVDDLGYMDIGAYNPHTFYETPHIDRLAREGMRFTNGYAACPVCSPSRYAILAGKYPSRVDATNYFSGKRVARFRPAVLNNRKIGRASCRERV